MLMNYIEPFTTSTLNTEICLSVKLSSPLHPIWNQSFQSVLSVLYPNWTLWINQEVTWTQHPQTQTCFVLLFYLHRLWEHLCLLCIQTLLFFHHALRSALNIWCAITYSSFGLWVALVTQETPRLSPKGSWESLQPPSQYWCILPVDTRVPLVVPDCLTFISYFEDILFFSWGYCSNENHVRSGKVILISESLNYWI